MYSTAQPQGNECLRVTRVRLARNSRVTRGQLASDSRATFERLASESRMTRELVKICVAMHLMYCDLFCTRFNILDSRTYR